jgi:hypothetical protein
MKKTILILAALVVLPSFGMAQVLATQVHSDCVGVKNGIYTEIPCSEKHKVLAENKYAFVIGPADNGTSKVIDSPRELVYVSDKDVDYSSAMPAPNTQSWKAFDGYGNPVIVTISNGEILLNGKPMAAGGAPAPEPVKPHLKATATPGSVTVQWTDTSAGAGVGYLIYRGATSGGESTTPLNSSPVDVGQACTTTAAYCTYNDTPTPGTQACYTVAANNATGTTAKASPDACVNVPLPIPAVPVLGPPVVN